MPQLRSSLIDVAAQWPHWLSHLLLTLATVGAAYLLGHVVRAVVVSRLARPAGGDPAAGDHPVVRELRSRITLWSVLIGLYLSLSYWPLTADWHLLAVRVLSSIGVASVTFALASLATRLVVTYGPRASVPVSGLSQNIVRILVIVIGLLIIVRSFGYDITPMLTALGVGGLAVALALQDPLSNFFAGLSVSLAGNVRIGDYIRLDSGAEGYLLDFNWRSTRLRQLAGNIVEVPNSKLAQAVVTNFTLPLAEMGIGVEITVAYANDLALVERLALEVATQVMASVPGGVVTAAPSVRFSAFVDTGVRLSVGARVQGFTDQFAVKHELIKRLHEGLISGGVQMPESPKP